MAPPIYRSQSLLKKIDDVCKNGEFVNIFSLFEPEIYGGNTAETKKLFLKDIETLYSLCFIEPRIDSKRLEIHNKMRITKIGRDFAEYFQ